LTILSMRVMSMTSPPRVGTGLPSMLVPAPHGVTGTSLSQHHVRIFDTSSVVSGQITPAGSSPRCGEMSLRCSSRFDCPTENRSGSTSAANAAICSLVNSFMVRSPCRADLNAVECSSGP
jgi:hypothetical protein